MTTRKVKHFIGMPGFNTIKDKPEVMESKDYKFIIMVFEGGFNKDTNTFTEDARHMAAVPSEEMMKVLKPGVNYAYEPRV